MSIIAALRNGNENGRTDDGNETLFPWNGFTVVAFTSFEGLCEINGVLLRFTSEIQFVDAALSDH